MRAAVCDDEKTAREEIITLIEDYCIERAVNIEYEEFESYLPLKERIEEFDVFIMDYQIPEIDGMSFAKTIREKYTDSKAIIFVTSFREIVYDAFSVRTHRFLIKPVDRMKFFEALDSYIYQNSKDKNLVIKNDGFTDVISASDIYYIEVRGKDCFICFENEKIVSRKSVSSLEQELSGGSFFRVHRYYLVNMRKIRSFDKTRIELANGETVEISSRKYPAFCREYLKLK